MKTIREYFCLLTVILLLILSITFLGPRAKTVLSQSSSLADAKSTVVIDAGHGGFDSGKIGIDGNLEKDINLSIAKKLARLLEAAGLNVVMTRTADVSLAENISSGKKKQDMLNRTALINEASADCVISIHQNSYPDESIKGAQVFYYSNSDSSKMLAALLQQQLIKSVDPSNHRVEKGEQSYYLLKNVHGPIVIAECGFLSNREESKKLADDAYQQKLAWAIHLGILQYLNLPNDLP